MSADFPEAGGTFKGLHRGRRAAMESLRSPVHLLADARRRFEWADRRELAVLAKSYLELRRIGSNRTHFEVTFLRDPEPFLSSHRRPAFTARYQAGAEVRGA